MLSMIIQTPASEPVTVQEVRDDLRLESGDELLLSTLITSARIVVEAETGCRLLTQSWDVMLDEWPENDGALCLPHWPVQQVSGVYLLGGRRDTVATDIMEYELRPRVPQIILKPGQSWPALKRNKLGVLVSLRAGFGDDAGDVPEPLRMAIRQLVAFWYEQADWHGFHNKAEIPGVIHTLLQPYKKVKL